MYDINLQFQNQKLLNEKNKFKNEIIWGIYKKMKEIESKTINDLVPEKIQEIFEWEKYFFFLMILI